MSSTPSRSPAALLAAGLCAGGVAACGTAGAPGAAPVVAAADATTAPCTIRGSTAVGAGSLLYRDRTTNAGTAVFTGAPVEVELSPPSVEAPGRWPVVVHTAGVTLRGFVDPWALPLRATRDLPLFGEVAVIPRGRLVALAPGTVGRLRVTAAYSDFPQLAADAACDAVGLGASEAPTETQAVGEEVHLAGPDAPVFGSSDGPPVGRLTAGDRHPTLWAGETRGERRLVRYDRGVRIAGWMRASDLAAGAGPDCDDCYGPPVRDLDDRCPDEPDPDSTEDTGCPDPETPPPVLVLPRAAGLFTEPAAASPVGEAETGASFWVFERRDGWARVRPRGSALDPARGSELWLRVP